MNNIYCPTNTGIYQGDLIIKTAVELALNDIRQNPWIIEDIFGSLIENPYLSQIYGMKEIDRAKEFFLNNDIPVYMRHRVDKQEFPCVTISIGDSKEDNSLAVLGDASHMVTEYSADDLGNPIKFIVNPFTPISYDPDTGIVEVPEDVEGYRYIEAGQIAVDPNTGEGYIVQGRAGNNGFRIDEGLVLSNQQFAIVPQYQQYRARREITRSQESYNIGCHVEGDPSTLMFLYSIVKYAMFRYREGLFEFQNFQLSNITSTDLIRNDAFGIENVYSRWITLKGQIEETWVKVPHRFIESVDFTNGIKILSNSEPEAPEDEIWRPIEEEGEE